MPKAGKPTDAWYTKLSEAEAREVYVLDTILASLKMALKAASGRRELIQNRASMRKIAVVTSTVTQPLSSHKMRP